ncbi:MAG: hypothetical protein U0183_31060 [Polyangiaceae bacterium]
MTRSRLLLTVLLVGTGSVFFAGTGCSASGVGDPCIPEQEYNEQFLGFSQKEVNVESKSFQCQTRVCLVNHFRGRVSCPYGQTAAGGGRSSDPCVLPGTVDGKVKGVPGAPEGAAVEPQCLNRKADATVYCSCRCANSQGKTDDGANYCACPDGFACEQLVDPTGQGNEGLTGGYCIKQNTKYDPGVDCQGDCDKAGGSRTTCAGEPAKAAAPAASK